MLPEFRKRFNESWTDAQFLAFQRALAARAGTEIGFRCLEGPVFLPASLLEKMIRYGIELYAQLAADTAYRTASDAAIPNAFRVPGEPEHPLFIQADFGLVRQADGTLEPKLVEIQAFPSIFAFQAELADQYQQSFQLNERMGAQFGYFLGGHSAESFRALMRRAVLGSHEPEQVVLLDIDPFAQKTLADFLATRRLLNIQIADVMQLEKRGRKLFFHGVEVRRIYNRVIVDELVRKQMQPAFNFTDDLDVEWAGHPNWFFRLSKFSLPWFRHCCVPPTQFLDEVATLPENLNDYVLKPLFSFAGAGVSVGPTEEEMAAIPPAQRHDYILQQRMNFVPVIDTPDGPTKLEVRIMYIRDQDRYQPVNTVIRTGRGKMMGVDFNKNLAWVGASAGFFVES